MKFVLCLVQKIVQLGWHVLYFFVAIEILHKRVLPNNIVSKRSSKPNQGLRFAALLNTTKVKRYEVSIWNYFSRLENYQGFEYMIFSNHCLYTMISTMICQYVNFAKQWCPLQKQFSN